jgi:hypothetical protein
MSNTHHYQGKAKKIMETQQQAPESAAKGRGHEIHFTVDGEPCETLERELTPNEILLKFAGKDPATHYLVQIQGEHRISYQGKGDEPIKMHNGMRFQVISTGPTPVSAPVW